MNIQDISKDLLASVTSILEKKNVKEVDEPKAKGEKDFKDLHTKDLEVYTEKLDPKADASEWIEDFIKSDAPQFKGKSKEERKEMALAAYYSARKKAGLEEGADKDVKGDKEAYQKFFQGMLKKFGVKSPAELSGDKEKEFYDAIDAGWKADDEKKESIDEEISLDEGMKMVNKKTGKDVTKHVNDFLAGKIDRETFEKRAGLTPKDRQKHWLDTKKEEVVKEAYKVVKLGGTDGVGGEFFMGDPGIKKMVQLSKKNPQVEYTVTSDNYGDFKQHWLKNGKFARKTVANINYDMAKNPVRGVPKGKTVKDTIFSLTQVVKEESLKESSTNAFYRTTRIHLALRNAGLKPNDAKKVTDALKIIYGGGSEYKGSEVENVVRAVIGDSMGRKLAAKTIEQLHDLSRSVTQKWGFNEAKSATGYEIYHKDFSTAMQHAYDFAKKKLKVEVDPEEIMTNVAMGPKRPSTGKTNSYRLKGKGGAIQVQVYNTGKSYELNMYKESVKEETLEERPKSMDPKKRLKIFNELKKGDKIAIAYDTPIAKADIYKDGELIYREFTVTRNKTVVGKARVEKITLAKDNVKSGVKFFLYNRDGSVSFAIGDMASVIVDMKKM